MATSKFLVMAMFFVLLLGSVSASEWDNIKSYDAEEKEITIYNWNLIGKIFDIKLAEYKLTANTDTCLRNCWAEGTAYLYEEERLFQNINSYDVMGNEAGIPIKIYTKETTIIQDEIPLYKEVCLQDVNETNYCYQNQTGINYINKTNSHWVEYDDRLMTGLVEWKVEGTKQANQNVDWITTAYGKELEEWAWWNASFFYCRDLQLQDTASVERYADKDVWIMRIDSSGWGNKPYNDSVRIVNSPCDEDGSEMRSEVWNITQTSGSMDAFNLTIFGNKSTEQYFNYSIYFHGSSVGEPDYGSITFTNDSAHFFVNKSAWAGTPIVDYQMNDNVGSDGEMDVPYFHIDTSQLDTASLCALKIDTDLIKMCEYTMNSGTKRYWFYDNNISFEWETTYGGTLFTCDTWGDAQIWASDNTYINVTGSGVIDMSDSDTNYALDEGIVYYKNSGTGYDFSYAWSFDNPPAPDPNLIRGNSGNGGGSGGLTFGYDGGTKGTNYSVRYIFANEGGGYADGKEFWYAKSNPIVYLGVGDEENNGDPITMTITLESQPDGYNSTSLTNYFNTSYSVANGNFTNSTLHIWNSTESLIVEELETITGASNSTNISTTFTYDDAYVWNNLVCAENSTISICEYDGSNFTLVVDTTIPTIQIAENLTNLTAFGLPINSTWNYSVADAGVGLSACYYNTSDNATYTFITCNDPQINTSWLTEGNKIVQYCANDTLNQVDCNMAYLQVYNVLTSQGDSPDPTVDGGQVTFLLEVNMTNIPNGLAYLLLNGTEYTSIPASTQNRTLFTSQVTMPPGYGNSTGYMMYWNWTYNLDGFLANTTTSTNNLTIYNVSIDDCTSNTIAILNISLYDEESNALVNVTPGTNVELELILTSQSDPSLTWEYSNTWTNENNVSVCVSPGVLNNTNFTIDFTIGADSTDRVWEFYYLDNGTLSLDSDEINSMTNKTVGVMDLLSADSTSFLFNYYDEDGSPVENAIVHVFRKYIGEGLFREVERAKEDENADTTVHLVEEDVIYYFVISLNGEVLYTSSTYTALCQATPCTIQLEASGEFSEFAEDWDMIENGGISWSKDASARTVSVNYSLTSSSTMNLTVYEYNEDGEYTALSTDTSTGLSDTLTVTVPMAVGNKSFFASVYQDGSFLVSEWVDLEEDAGVYFGNTLALFLGFLIILSLGLMAISEGGGTIFWVIFGMIITAVLGLVDYHTPTGAGLLIYLVCAGMIIIFKLAGGKR